MPSGWRRHDPQRDHRELALRRRLRTVLVRRFRVGFTMILPDRFLEKVMPVTECGCWFWLGSLNANGYGRFAANGKNRHAHRFSYETLVGPIPHGLHLDHLCRVPCCVNPEHLEPVTNAENVLRGWKARGKYTHCKHGHLIDGITNWRIGTTCRACLRISAAKPENRAKKNAHERARYHAMRKQGAS